MLDRLDLDTEKPSEEDLAKKFGYEEDYYKGDAIFQPTLLEPYNPLLSLNNKKNIFNLSGFLVS